MKDGFNREIDYLRISVTDRCNLRCIYCMPKDGVNWIDHQEILTYEEIERLCRIFARLGVKNFKITGGEPLVRRDLAVLIKKLKKISGVNSVTLTTNGVLLEENLDALLEAGLDGVNISLDSLNKDNYESLTGREGFEKTIRGIEAALKHPSLRVKVNCVPLKGKNDKELVDIAKLAENKPLSVRFIEMMPIGYGKNFEFMGEEEIIELFEEALGPLKVTDEAMGNGPAHYYKAEGFMGRIGFISARTHKFCEGCNRVRLTSEGYLKTCLQYSKGVLLKDIIRRGGSDNELKESIIRTLLDKPQSHEFEKASALEDGEKRRMFSIGG